VKKTLLILAAALLFSICATPAVQAELPYCPPAGCTAK